MTSTIENLTQKELERVIKLLTHDLEKLVVITARVLQRLAEGTLDMHTPQHRSLVISAGQGMERARQMITDLNEVMLNRKLPVCFREVSLTDILTRVAKRFAPMAENEGIRFDTQYFGAGTISTDPDLLTRIMENYLYNALSHTQTSGWIQLRARTDNTGGYDISVANYGPVIPLADIGQIFDMGVQLDLKHKHLWQGRGLGLAFCKMAAEAIHARVDVRNLGDHTGVIFYCQKGDLSQ